MYNAGWAWAGSTPYKHTKLIASHFGGTRNPLAVKWPAKIKARPTPRPQFHHVNDVVPTIYEIIGDHAAARRQRLRAGPDRRREPRLYVRRRQGQGEQEHPIFRDHGQPRRLSRWLVCLAIGPVACFPACEGRSTIGVSRLDAGQRRVGTLQHRRRLVASQRPRGEDARKASRK